MVGPAEAARVGERAGWALLLLTLMACTETPPPAQDFRPGPEAAVRLQGRLEGPLPGLGPRVDLDLWMRSDHALRADLRFEGEEGPRHEILLWTPHVAWLYDRRRLRHTELGPKAGDLEALGGIFRVEELWWLLLGRVEEQWLPAVEWTVQEGQVRGEAAEKGYRRPSGLVPAWGEILWRDPAARVHHLRVDRSDWRESSLGPFPGRLEWEGSDLEGRVTLDWTLESFSAVGDSVFDPLWEPQGP